MTAGRPFDVADVVRAGGGTRQAAHRHLRRLVEAGVLRRTGVGRATRYEPVAPHARFAVDVPTVGLAEDRLWDQARERLPELTWPQNANTIAVARYAFTEMVNNAIDHSGADHAQITATTDGEVVRFTVADAGIGAFENVRARLHLPDHLAALQEISKGKTSTQPDRHSGEGIFFTSKACDLFELQANRLKWTVDNLRADESIAVAATSPGTVVRFVVALGRAGTLDSVFARYTHDFDFDTTRTVVKLFAYGVSFVSRSEAKRLLRGLEKFRHVVLDFAGVEGVGQGFADEVFRVWAREHPGVTLTPENMVAPVAFMVERARRAR